MLSHLPRICSYQISVWLLDVVRSLLWLVTLVRYFDPAATCSAITLALLAT